MKKNIEFNKWVEKKILKRLAIFAEHNKERTSSGELLSKGEDIFSSSERDKTHAAEFLVVLLDCIEKWAFAFPFTED
jgi:hypothetical protein